MRDESMHPADPSKHRKHEHAHAAVGCSEAAQSANERAAEALLLYHEQDGACSLPLFELVGDT